MALTKTVTRLFPSLDNRNVATVGLHLELKDGVETVIDQPVTETYVDGQPIAPIKKALKDKAQELIDKYKKNKALNIKTAYTNAISQIGDELEV